MRTLTLKVDVDTLRGTREGAPRLATLLSRLRIPATFLFSLGPDHTGRALKRIFRPGFLRKVLRTSVPSHYGLRTLLYGTLLPGPDIGRRCREDMLAIAGRGFEVGVHAWDHVTWQDTVATASLAWTRDSLSRAKEAFERIFRSAPRVHGAAGWQLNAHVPSLERELGFDVASDTRGREPFLPAGGGSLQLPTTLPTLDELIGVNGATAWDAVRAIVARTNTPGNHVYTLHAELEGGACLPHFEKLLVTWRDAGFVFQTLGDAARSLDRESLRTCSIIDGEVEGRSGKLALQGAR